MLIIKIDFEDKLRTINRNQKAKMLTEIFEEQFV